jgi:L-fucose isomerase, second N-terminal domain
MLLQDKVFMKKFNLIFIVTLILHLPNLVRAEEFEAPRLIKKQPCRVSVRMIKGSRKAEGFAGKEMKTKQYLHDVKPHLKSLPYGKYKVVDSGKQIVQMRESGHFVLTGYQEQKHSVDIMPISRMKPNLVQVMVDWTGPKQEQLLSTKVKLTNGKSMVVGTENTKDVSTLICVTVDCSKK